MVNINKLRGRMVEQKVNADKMAELLGINRSTFYRKLENNGDLFTIKEVQIMSKALKLNLDDVNDIFFADKVA